MLEFETTRKVRPHIGIAPLIDCVFQLLIFFLLSSYFVAQPGLRITLPEAQIPQSQKEDISIFITKDNDILIGEQKVDIENLKSVLDKIMKKSHKKIIVMKADEKINLGLAVNVMDIAKDAGAENVIISTRLRKYNAGR